MTGYYLIVAALAGTLALYLFTPRESQVDHQCQLGQGACLLESEDFKGSFSLKPWPIHGSRPAYYELTVAPQSTYAPETVSIQLVGESMHMDQDNFSLEDKGKGVFQVWRDFPLCQEKRMIWRLMLLMKKGNHFKRTFFDLEVMR